MKKLLRPLLLLFLAFPLMTFAGDRTPEEEAVYQAVLDYVEGIYNGEPERIKRSVHPELKKHGFYMRDGQYMNIPMEFEQLVQLAATWKKQGRIPANPPLEITLFEVNDQTAAAKLIAFGAWTTFTLPNTKANGRFPTLSGNRFPKRNKFPSPR